jgi:hypothetical protein
MHEMTNTEIADAFEMADVIKNGVLSMYEFQRFHE